MKLAALALLLVGAAAQAQDPPDLKGLRIGMTQTEVLAAIPMLRCVPAAEAGEITCGEQYSTILGHPARLYATLAGGTVQRVRVSFAANHAEEVKKALLDKFGAAAGGADKPIPWKSKYGVMTARYLLVWNFDADTLLMSYVEDGSIEPWVLLSSKEYMRLTTERMNRDRDRKKKDL